MSMLHHSVGSRTETGRGHLHQSSVKLQSRIRCLGPLCTWTNPLDKHVRSRAPRWRWQKSWVAGVHITRGRKSPLGDAGPQERPEVQADGESALEARPFSFLHSEAGLLSYFLKNTQSFLNNDHWSLFQGSLINILFHLVQKNIKKNWEHVPTQ